MKIRVITALIILLATSSSFAAGNPVKGKETSQQCIACHGEDGNSPTPNFPRLAGQHADYLYYALQSYKKGERKNAIMAGIVGALSDDDMRNLAAYFAKQTGLGAINAKNETKMMQK